MFADLVAVNLDVVTWWGIRIFNDAVAPDAEPPPEPELSELLEVETRASGTDPYRWFGSQLHVLARARCQG